MIDTQFRKFFSKFAMPVTKFLRSIKANPNIVTVMAFLISSSAAWAIAYDRPYYALLLWWGGRFFDSMDGELARLTGKTTPFGGFLDITLDMLAYSSIIVGFYFRDSHFHHYYLFILVLYVGCITSALALGTLFTEAQIKNDDNRTLRLASGLAEGGETGIAYTLFFLSPINFLSCYRDGY